MRRISAWLAAAAVPVAAPAQPADPDAVLLSLPAEASARLAEQAQSASFMATGAGPVIVADQALMAVVANAGTNVVVAVEAGRFRTGDNAIGDTAFAVFSGILTQSWNSGVNANSQAATNIAWGSAGQFRLGADAGERGDDR